MNSLSDLINFRYNHYDEDEALRRTADLAGNLIGQAVKGKSQKIVNMEN